jgi:hypothetical protein
MLSTLGGILDVLTMAVGALGGISLLVGGVGIVTIMTIAVTERTNEIGLMVALGARRQTILGLFLGEAVALAAIGGLVGLLLGIGLAQLIGLFVPALPVHTPLSFVLLAEALAAAIGLAAGVLPASARRAAGSGGGAADGVAGESRRRQHGDFARTGASSLLWVPHTPRRYCQRHESRLCYSANRKCQILRVYTATFVWSQQ